MLSAFVHVFERAREGGRETGKKREKRYEKNERLDLKLLEREWEEVEGDGERQILVEDIICMIEKL